MAGRIEVVILNVEMWFRSRKGVERMKECVVNVERGVAKNE